MNAPLRPPAPRHAPVLLWIVAICAGLELLFTLLDTPFLSLSGPRNFAIIHGAFWPRLLVDWSPLFPGQRVTMFITYAFLHGGFMHMLFNMLMLLHLGRETVIRLGQRGFLLAFVVTSAGGAGAYALLASVDAPMLGASGAVFGLFGTTMYWDFQRRRALRASLEPVWRLLIGLVVMNVALYFLVGGMLAWQTHLGGFVTGVAFAWITTPTLTHRYRHHAPKPRRAPKP
ncbi:rhomboid family intramembrane serine protease [Pararhodobacter sp.]|uniref:rhomboid family intramembrane serine protease n=1 Tax=Pararhodobacter sp. TaxID=2127056 RepID=UPI002AFFC7B0|nr:rhomboid family intramembrane serine protease [Pararhodobacter sp.]